MPTGGLGWSSQQQRWGPLMVLVRPCGQRVRQGTRGATRVGVAVHSQKEPRAHPASAPLDPDSSRCTDVPGRRLCTFVGRLDPRSGAGSGRGLAGGRPGGGGPRVLPCRVSAHTLQDLLHLAKLSLSVGVLVASAVRVAIVSGGRQASHRAAPRAQAPPQGPVCGQDGDLDGPLAREGAVLWGLAGVVAGGRKVGVAGGAGAGRRAVRGGERKQAREEEEAESRAPHRARIAAGQQMAPPAETSRAGGAEPRGSGDVNSATR